MVTKKSPNSWKNFTNGLWNVSSLNIVTMMPTLMGKKLFNDIK